MARRLTSFQGADDEPALLARRQVDRVQRRVRRQHRRLRRAGRRRRAEAADVASRRRHRAGLDARRQVDRVRVDARDVGAERARRASGPCRSRAASKSRWRCRARYQGKISADGTHIAYRMNNSWDEERRNYRGGQNRPIWIVDLEDATISSRRRGPTRRTWIRSGSATRVYFISDRDGVANVWSYDTEGEEARAGHAVHRLRREDARRRRRRGRVRAGRLHPRARSEERQGARSCTSRRPATSRG